MSNTQTKNVPELRFPGFEGEWEEKKLGNLTTKIGSGKTPKGGSENYTNKGIPFLRSQNIRNGKLNLNDLVYISKDIDDEMKNSRTYYGDVLLNITGASIGRTAINSIVETHANLNQHVCIIRLKKEYYYNFFGQYLLSRKGKRKIFLAQSGGSREGLNFKEIANLKIFTPTIFEEQKLELLQQQKKCYIQKIFSQELRFKDEEGNYYKGWNKKQLKDVLEFSNKRTINENEYPVLTSSRQGLILQSDYYKDRKTFAESNIGYFILPKNHITYRSRSDDGIFKFNLNLMIDVGIISKYYPVFKGIDANQYYLTLHLNYQLKKEYIKYATGTSQLVLSQKDLQNIKTKLPSYEEQQKIGDFFSEIDRLVEKQSSKVGRLKVRKKELLQKMFV
ncbi:restriction endonuclease subunit S [Staphylococcus aureus]|uniref:restriction endonuclease subunit S n=1 Tax=Staphylococcus aureus TaxID=1280 RepID=UPI002A824D97|nr:restriction endonuclease subunit S [Staphylococcus aureus]MDY4328803.1 restriction endonuclease subunit S [Staphylococcus aureus]